MEISSAVELFGGPCDGQRRVVRNDVDLIPMSMYVGENLDAEEPVGDVRTVIYRYVRDPDRPDRFVLDPR